MSLLTLQALSTGDMAGSEDDSSRTFFRDVLQHFADFELDVGGCASRPDDYALTRRGVLGSENGAVESLQNGSVSNDGVLLINEARTAGTDLPKQKEAVAC